MCTYRSYRSVLECIWHVIFAKADIFNTPFTPCTFRLRVLKESEFNLYINISKLVTVKHRLKSCLCLLYVKGKEYRHT